MKKLFLILFLIFANNTYTAKPNMWTRADVEVKINGLVCSICANGLMKSFKKHFLVRSVGIDIQEGVLYIDFSETKGGALYPLKNDKIIDMVKKNGYEVKSIKWLRNKKPNRYNKP